MKLFGSRPVRIGRIEINETRTGECRQSVLCVVLLIITAITFTFAAVATSWNLYTGAFNLIRVH